MAAKGRPFFMFSKIVTVVVTLHRLVVPTAHER
jgi:hypothetical protein